MNYSTRWSSVFAIGIALLSIPITCIRAQVSGPGWIQPTANPVSIAEADKYYQQRAPDKPRLATEHAVRADAQTHDALALEQPPGPIASPAVAAFPSAAEISPEIRELARGLMHDPKLIYEYVRNHVDYVPYFGSLKGATLTYYDNAGNDFDQASLMIALLRASGYTARYEYGTMTMPWGPGSALTNWLGSEYHGAQLLAWGGIPFQVSLSSGAATISRVWVRVNINGTEYLLDPAFKRYRRGAKIDLGQAMKYNRAELLAAAGGTFTNDSVQNMNETALAAKLTEYASNLVSTLRAQHANAKLEDVLGGRSIVMDEAIALTSTLPFAATAKTAWDEIPPEFSSTLRIQYGGIDRTLATTQFGGKRLTITHAAANFRPELRLEGDLIAAGNPTTAGAEIALTWTIDHPYSDRNGTYYDQTDTTRLTSGATYALVCNFGGFQGRLSLKRQRQLDDNKSLALSETSEPVLGENLNVIGESYLRQVALSESLFASISGGFFVRHHNIGLVRQEAGVTVDMRFNGVYWVPENTEYDYERFDRFGITFGSALEHGVLEQVFTRDVPAVSTVKLLRQANAAGNRIFLLHAENFAARRTQLRNYSASKLDQLQGDVVSGRTAWVIMHEDGQLAINNWRGFGYVGMPGTALTGGWLISGDFLGGATTAPKKVTTDVTKRNLGTNHTPAHRAEVGKQTAQDPVEMASGAYTYDITDFSLGSAGPRNLAFARAYHSGLNRERRTIGFGWTHNLDVYLQRSSHGDHGLGGRHAIDAAALIAAAYVAVDFPPDPRNLQLWMVTTLVYNWAMDRLIDNIVSVHIQNQKLEYVRLAGGSYSAPPSVTTTLVRNADGTFVLQERLGRRIEFNTANRVALMTDSDGNRTTFTYDATGNVTKVADAFGHTLTFEYAGGQIVSVSDSAGRSARYRYDNNGDLVVYTDPEAKEWQYVYDKDHRMTTLLNPLGIAPAMNAYDEPGRVTAQTMPRDGGTNVTAHFYFSPFRNSEKDPLGNMITYYYDRHGNPLGRDDAVGSRWRHHYDGQNHVIESIDPRGNSTKYVYDENHNLIRVVNPKGEATRYVYDNQFHRTHVVSPLGHKTHMEYDARHHLVAMTNAVGVRTQAAYQANGLTQSETNSRGIATTFSYDAYGNPASMRIANQPAVNFVYDSIGRMTGLTDQVGSTTTFAYDKRGLVTVQTDPLGKTTSLTYDAAGQMTAVKDRKGDTTATAYTPTGKIKKIALADGASITFSYDVRDNLVTMQDAIGTTTYVYDAANRLASTTDPHGFTVVYEYDAAGNVVRLIYPGNKAVQYGYDEVNRVRSVTNWLGHTAIYTYDAAGRITSLVNFNGTKTTYLYDDANRLIELENRKADGAAICTYRYTLDANGNRRSIVRNEPLAAGLSPLTVSYTYNAQKNRLLSSGSDNFSYDAEGQLAMKGASSFIFDKLHRLVEVGSGTLQQFAYDGEGRRLQATRGGIVTRYIYGASGNLLAEANASGSVTRYYLYGTNLLAMNDLAGGFFCYHFDAVGSTAAITDNAQAIVNAYTYGVFGEMTSQSEAISQPFKFVGEFGVMAESDGVYSMRARYYDSRIGRFISEDPSGFGGGDSNLYAYVGNNPVSRIDPSGLIGQFEVRNHHLDPGWKPQPATRAEIQAVATVVVIGSVATGAVVAGGFLFAPQIAAGAGAVSAAWPTVAMHPDTWEAAAVAVGAAELFVPGPPSTPYGQMMAAIQGGVGVLRGGLQNVVGGGGQVAPGKGK